VPRHLQLNVDVHDSPVPGLFMQEALQRDLTRFLDDIWPTTVTVDSSDALWLSRNQSGTDVVLDLGDGTLGRVHVGFGNAYAQVAAASEEAAKAGLEKLRSLFPRSKEREGRVLVRFWSYGPHGPMPMGRTLSVPSWEEIAGNYAGATGDGLVRLMTGDLPWRGGQLILWHGETGTGKTTALRALTREWSSWCEPHYITDPEKFFGNQSDYMLSVMLQSETFGDEESEGFATTGIVTSVGEGMWAVPPVQFYGRRDGDATPTWRLLILEDTGELLSADARMQAGQGLSRFLNVVDGLIGQGLRILVLVTTNEELGKLHPAISRPGRCASNVLFTPMPVEQANAWLAERENESTVTEPRTLAELYALVEGWDAVTERQQTGFG
jgi:Domain of unknown function (DUF5925)/ATPase family associated with various cellular activities (AAA)